MTVVLPPRTKAHCEAISKAKKDVLIKHTFQHRRRSARAMASLNRARRGIPLSQQHRDAVGAAIKARHIKNPSAWKQAALKHAVLNLPAPDCKEVVGKPVGHIRNKKMLDMNPDIVLAFHKDFENSKSTRHMVAIARLAHIKTKVFDA